MLLLTTLNSGLVSEYGEVGARRVLSKVDQYLYAVSATDPNAASAVLDDRISMDAFGLPPQPVGDPAAITAALQLVASSPRLHAAVTDILIFGGDEVFPFWRVVNPVTDRTADPDPQVLTDNLYAALGSNSAADWLNPPTVVGRILPGSGVTADDFSSVIDLLLQNRQNRPPRTGSCVLSNRNWQPASQSAAASLQGPLQWLLSPSDQVTPGNAAELNHRFLYCNLHGFDNEPAWKGYDSVGRDFVVALTPDSLIRDYVAGATVFTEACYGLQVAGKNAAVSCAVKFLCEGALAVIGATGLAFGSASEWQTTLLDADRLARGFFDAAGNAATVGGCLKAGRNALIGNGPSGLNEYEKKTLLQFCLLGDPTHAYTQNIFT